MNTRILAATAALILAGLCATPAAFAQSAPTSNPNAASSAGSAAFPAPVPQGNLATTSTLPRTPTDTGSMAFPAPLPQGTIATTPGTVRPTDTGNMAYPAPVPQGNIATTPVK